MRSALAGNKPERDEGGAFEQQLDAEQQPEDRGRRRGDVAEDEEADQRRKRAGDEQQPEIAAVPHPQRNAETGAAVQDEEKPDDQGQRQRPGDRIGQEHDPEDQGDEAERPVPEPVIVLRRRPCGPELPHPGDKEEYPDQRRHRERGRERIGQREDAAHDHERPDGDEQNREFHLDLLHQVTSARAHRSGAP